MAKISEVRKKECKERLLEILKPGDIVYCILRHKSRSGMMRVIDLYALENNDLRWIGLRAADLLELPWSKLYNGIRVQGVGMDTEFRVVYSLSHRLFGDGYALKHRWL